MPQYSQFLFEAILISLSGVMTPGPMTTMCVSEGSKSPKAGSLIAVGHGLFEFPFMILLFLGFGFVLNFVFVKTAIGILGGIFLLFMGFGLFRDILQTEKSTARNQTPASDHAVSNALNNGELQEKTSPLKESTSDSKTVTRMKRGKIGRRHPVVSGFILSAANPYFLIWWATIGVALILRSIKFGFIGFIIFAFLHWLCDFIWYAFLSNLAFRGGKIFGTKFQTIVSAICGISLTFFGIKFIYDAVKTYSI